MAIKSETRTNRLIHEKSPYLLQHAHNPVDWYPWGKEAFEKSKKEEKPIFLSIGYSTCHWCHVMEEESFVNPDIAQILNESFVSIKVDREERPDVDHIYMQAVTAMTGSGGWPMSVFLTPDLKPFYGGTYFPPTDKWGKPGFITVLNALREKWKTERDHIIRAGSELALALSEQADRERPNHSVEKETEDVAFQELQSDFDSEFGGFGGAPKFPRTHILSFLLRYSQKTRNLKAMEMVERTLERMSAGGINDHLAGGFHRYSTDRVWHIPHFEKMLYDQAIISKTYLEAFQMARKESDAREAKRIFEYVLNNLTDSRGAFYSAEDADSVPPENRTGKKVEGAFYVWTFDELTHLLGKNAEIFCDYFGVRKDGNATEDPHGEFKGKNILFTARTIQETSEKFNKSANKIEKILDESVSLLLKERSQRPKPHLDDKILTDWNGLMISSLAYGARVLNDARYAGQASKAADFILSHMKRSDGRLMHRFRDGETAILGFLEDYAFLIHGLLDLYEATFQARYLKEAHALAEEMIRLFWDESKGGFLLVGKDGETLIAPSKELYDGAIPSGNSVATLDLLRLGRITGNQKLEEIAKRNFQVFSTELLQYPSGFSQMLIAYDFSIGPVREIVIHGKQNDPRTQSMIREVSKHFLPNAVILLDPHEGENSKLIREFAPFVKAQATQASQPTVFVCKNYSCELPVTEPKQLEKLLQG